MTDQQSDPVVVKYAAFEISPAAYDELTRRLQARGYHHLFENDCILMQYIGLTRGPDAKPEPFMAAWVLENGKEGFAHQYLGIDTNGLVVIPQALTDEVLRFARKEDADRFAKFMTVMLKTNQGDWKPVPHVWA